MSISNFVPPFQGPGFFPQGFGVTFRPAGVTALVLSFWAGAAIGISFGILSLVTIFLVSVPLGTTALALFAVLGAGQLALGALQLIFAFFLFRMSRSGWTLGLVLGILGLAIGVVITVFSVLMLLGVVLVDLAETLIIASLVGSLVWAVIFGLGIGIFGIIYLTRRTARAAFGRLSARDLLRQGQGAGMQQFPGQFGQQFGGPYGQQFGGPYGQGGFPQQQFPGGFGQQGPYGFQQAPGSMPPYLRGRLPPQQQYGY